MAPSRSFASAGSAGGPAAANDAFGLSDVLALSRKRSKLIRDIALGTIAATLLVLFLLPSTYTATAVVMLDPRKNNVAELSSVLSEQPTDPASVQNQIQILTSRDLAGEVIQQLDLADDPELNAALSPSLFDALHWSGPSSPEAQYSRLIDNFLRHLSVESIGLSTAMSVTYTSRDPTKAARVSNAIVGAYIRSEMEVNAEAGHRTTAWLVQRIRQLAQQAQISEANVQRYKAENAINDTGDGSGSLVEQQLAAINAQLVQARADLAAKQANFDRISSLLKSGDAADVSEVVSSPLIVQLRTQQSEAIRDQSEIASRYGPRHPKRIAAESQLRNLQAKIDQEVSRIAGSVANDLAVVRAQVKSLEQSLAQTEARDNDQNLARVQLKALESDAASTRTMYESFVTRLRETQGQDVAQISDARVISHASVPTAPSAPKRLLIFGASIPAGILLGLLCALMVERGHAPGSAMGVRPRGSPPALVEVPQASLPRAADLVCDAPNSPFACAMRALADRVAGGSRVLAVSSFDFRDGPSNVAVGLSRALGQSGLRVVLIDAQPPRSAWAMCAAPTGIDAAEVLRGTIPLNRALANDPLSRVVLLSAAAGDAWLSPRMREMIHHLERTADMVVINAPPLWTAEMAQIAPFAQAFLVVAPKSSHRLTELMKVLSHSAPPSTTVILAT